MGDFADYVKSCSNITSSTGIRDLWEYRAACKYRSKGWLDQAGRVTQELETRYSELSGVGDKIKACLDQGETKSKKLKKAGSRILKRKSVGGKSRGKKANKKLARTRRSVPIMRTSKSKSKTIKSRRQLIRKHGKKQQKINKKKRGTKSAKKRRNQGNKTRKSSGSKEKKKQRREKKKILRSIPLDQLPSQHVLSTLDCAEWKIADGLEMCVRKVVETSLNV